MLRLRPVAVLRPMLLRKKRFMLLMLDDAETASCAVPEANASKKETLHAVNAR